MIKTAFPPYPDRTYECTHNETGKRYSLYILGDYLNDDDCVELWEIETLNFKNERVDILRKEYKVKELKDNRYED